MSINRELGKHLAYWAVLAIMFGVHFTYKEALYRKSEEVIVDM